MTFAVRSDYIGHHTDTLRRKKIRPIPYLVFSTFPCRSTIEKKERRLLNNSRKRSTNSTGVGTVDLHIVSTDRAN